MKHLSFILVVVFLSSCSKDFYVSYQSNAERTGKVVILPSEPTSQTTVTLDDNIIIKSKNVKSLTIDNVPEGEVKINYVSNNSTYKDKLNQEMFVNVINGKETTQLIQTPPRSTGYWIYSGLGGLVALYLLFLSPK